MIRFVNTGFLALLLTVLCVPSIRAQLKDPYFSVSVEPTASASYLWFKPSVSSHIKDSLNKADRFRTSVGFNFQLVFNTGKKNRFYTGLQYLNIGFTRRKDNLHFLDTIHPEIGIMNDLSQTGGAYVDFKYRYHYVGIPLLFSRQISGSKSKNLIVHACYGLSVSALIKHDIRADLHGFSTRGGVKKHILEDKNESSSYINANAMAGIRFENLLYGKDTWIFAQPGIILPLLSANTARERHHLYGFSMQIGILYRPVKDKDKS